ncbi:MAG: TlpA disulfide reductase family protein [Flavobacteriaceae bacterium]
MKSFKKYLIPIALGLVVTLIMALTMLKVTMNFQILLFLGFGLFFMFGLLNSKSTINKLLNALLISFSFLTLFIFLVLAQIPELYYFIPIYFIACLFGIYFRTCLKKVVLSGVLAIAFLAFLAIKVIPVDIENSLTKIKSEPLPTFEILDLEGNLISSESLKEKVVVLDFFGTWCVPCIKELKELDKVQKEFANVSDVEIYIINADIGGDTPEKFETFINKHDYNFNFVYDTESKLFKALNLQNSGLPVLLIIDKNNNIRFQHVGYNPAETNFKDHIVETINSFR